MITPEKKVILILIAFILYFSLDGVVYAAGDGLELAVANPIGILWANTTSVEVNLTIPSGKAICGACVLGKPGTTEITGQAVLARRNSNGSYTTVKTWSDLQATGNKLLFDGNHFVSTGVTYRLTISATVYRNGTGETVTAYYEAYAS